AVKWYLRAARQGRVDALFPLGSIYELRANGPRDLLEAHRWYSLAADLVPAGKAREIIVGRRDRVAKRLTPELLATAQAASPMASPAATEAMIPAATRAPIETAAAAEKPAPLPDRPANRAPRAPVFAPPGETAADTAPDTVQVTAQDTVVLAENAAGGTVLGSFSAADPDAGDELAFALREDADGRFAVDPASGTLSVAEDASLDFEAAAKHEIVVRVTDSGGLFAERSLKIELADRNEAPEAEALALTVAETAAGGAALGRIRAVDPDGGNNGALRYRLDDDGPFAVDPATGELFLAKGAGLDYETTPRFDLAVTVTDGGGLGVRVPVSVAVEDRNEKPTLAAGAFALDETAGSGVTVGRVQGADPDAGGNGELRYAMAEGPGSADFVIDAESGEITVADGARLDFETRPAIELSVTVTDGGGLASDAPVRIALSDANEPPAALEMTGGVVAERAEPGTVVAELVARDPHAGERLTFSLVDDAGGRFAIDPASGTVTVGDGAELDFDAAAAHRIRVRVTDSGGLGLEETLSLAVTDENFAPTWTARAEASVAENAEGGTLVTEIAASDPDAGERLT
ncbi:MAG: cadherin domain-containing protein, partial [Kiloniellales bacterium]|nr:cadherin domain-containing protein [Kiloniellales bacterium]